MNEDHRDQGNGPDQTKRTVEELYLESVSRAARTRLEVVHLERTLAALQAQLSQEEAASADLLRKLRGIEQVPAEEVRARPHFSGPPFPNFRTGNG